MIARISDKQLKLSGIICLIAACSVLTAMVLAQTVPPNMKIEAESGGSLSGASVATDTTASGGSYLAFNAVAPPPPPPTGALFFEDFTGDTSIDSLNSGVWHRDPYLVEMGSWPGDHESHANGDCGGPTTTRTVNRSPLSEAIYLCRSVDGDGAKAHIMTSVGDTSGYSIAYFSPKQAFNSVKSISFNVNLTNLGDRKWWKAGVVSEALYNSTWNESCCGPAPGFLLADTGSPGLSGLDGPDRLIGTWGEDRTAVAPFYPAHFGIGSNHTVGSTSTDPNDKATRHPVSLVDNKNGTITFTVAGVSVTQSGAFPACPCKVVIYDHSYTPNKSFVPRVENPYTWHWDNIRVD
jgi:hypothetical protein